eukprot:scaffold8505_cov130-Cylindrotheca_fusiformis.AAC.21
MNVILGDVPANRVHRFLVFSFPTIADNLRLGGTIPSEIGLLVNVEEIKFARNSVTGEIPTELGLLSNLERLYVHLNKLEGNVPTELGQLTNLRYVRLQENLLTGEVPDEVCDLRDGALDQLILDCVIDPDDDTAEVDCAEPECCTECY